MFAIRKILRRPRPVPRENPLPPEGADLRDRAARGDVVAQTLWAQALLDGTYMPANPTAARQWFAIAAGAGFGPAQNMLGRCHERGWGGIIDNAKAAEAYQSAIARNDDWARYNLGNMTLRGRGVVQDRAQAYTLFAAAAGNGHAKSMNLLARCLEEGWGCQRNRRDAQDWYQRSAEAGDYRGQHNFAVLLAEGGDVHTAIIWWERALPDATPDILEAMAVALDRIDTASTRLLRDQALARLNASPSAPDGTRTG